VNILVTGGAGFIGSNFTRFWVERHPGDHVARVRQPLGVAAPPRDGRVDVDLHQ